MGANVLVRSPGCLAEMRRLLPARLDSAQVRYWARSVCVSVVGRRDAIGAPSRLRGLMVRLFKLRWAYRFASTFSLAHLLHNQS